MAPLVHRPEVRRQLATFARRIDVGESRLHKLSLLIYLRPRTLSAMLTGTLSPRTTLGDLLGAAQHLEWLTQERHLGIPA